MTRTYDVVTCIKASLTIRVNADSEDSAEELAGEALDAAFKDKNFGLFDGVKEDDRAVHRISVAKPE